MNNDDIHRVIGMAMSAKQEISELRKVVQNWAEADTEIYPPELTAVLSKADAIDQELDAIFELLNKR